MTTQRETEENDYRDLEDTELAVICYPSQAPQIMWHVPSEKYAQIENNPPSHGKDSKDVNPEKDCSRLSSAPS